MYTGFGFIASSTRIVDWKNPGDDGELWVWLLRDAGPDVVKNGGSVTYDDGWGTSMSMTVPRMPDLSPLYAIEASDSPAMKECKLRALRVAQQLSNNNFEHPLEIAKAAKQSGVPDPSIWPVIEALKAAHEQSAAYVSKLEKSKDQIARNMLRCANPWKPPVPVAASKPAQPQINVAAMKKVVARPTVGKVARSNSSNYVPFAIGAAVLTAAFVIAKRGW